MIPNWTNADAARLREFLGQETGSKLIQGLTSAAHGLPRGTTIEQEALSARETRGMRNAIEVIVGAATFEEPVMIERSDIDIESALKNYGSN